MPARRCRRPEWPPAGPAAAAPVGPAAGGGALGASRSSQSSGMADLVAAGARKASEPLGLWSRIAGPRRLRRGWSQQAGRRRQAAAAVRQSHPACRETAPDPWACRCPADCPENRRPARHRPEAASGPGARAALPKPMRSSPKGAAGSLDCDETVHHQLIRPHDQHIAVIQRCRRAAKRDLAIVQKGAIGRQIDHHQIAIVVFDHAMGLGDLPVRVGQHHDHFPARAQWSGSARA